MENVLADFHGVLWNPFRAQDFTMCSLGLIINICS